MTESFYLLKWKIVTKMDEVIIKGKWLVWKLKKKFRKKELFSEFRDFSGSVYVSWFQTLKHMNCIDLSCEV